MITLKLNERYDIEGGYIVPRSHFKEYSGANYAIFQITIVTGGNYVTKYTTYSRSELAKLLGHNKRGPKVEII